MNPPPAILTAIPGRLDIWPLLLGLIWVAYGPNPLYGIWN